MVLALPPVRAHDLVEIGTSVLRWIGSFDPFGHPHTTR
jgi:hypothetical protein